MSRTPVHQYKMNGDGMQHHWSASKINVSARWTSALAKFKIGAEDTWQIAVASCSASSLYNFSFLPLLMGPQPEVRHSLQSFLTASTHLENQDRNRERESESSAFSCSLIFLEHKEKLFTHSPQLYIMCKGSSDEPNFLYFLYKILNEKK